MSEVDQLYIFLVSAVCGVVGGLLYDAISLVRLPFSSLWIRYITDMLFCCLFAVLYLTVSVLCEFPDLRMYAFAACIVGFVLYLKSLHKIVAFLAKKIYNRIKPIQKDKKICRKREARGLRRKKSERS